MPGQSDFQPNDILVLQHTLSETEPLTTLSNSEVIDLVALPFLPESGCPQATVSLQLLHADHFGRENKLSNALPMTTAFPNMTNVVGVMWATESIIKASENPFAELMNLSGVDGVLFPKHGNFPRPKFVFLLDAEARVKVRPEHTVDFREILLIAHEHAQFTAMVCEASISGCRRDNPLIEGKPVWFDEMCKKSCYWAE
jgi:hypothetical protein